MKFGRPISERTKNYGPRTRDGRDTELKTALFDRPTLLQFLLESG
jgi:hypothetical protein